MVGRLIFVQPCPFYKSFEQTITTNFHTRQRRPPLLNTSQPVEQQAGLNLDTK